MAHTLMELPYAYNALEPYIDAQTMEIHHTKHHQAYVNNLNKVLEKYPELMAKSVVDLLKELNTLPVDDATRIAIRNHGGGVANHNLFWQIMNPKKQIDEALKQEVELTFGSLEKFKELFSQAAAMQFGSGWAWLIRDQDGKLAVYSLPNQDSPLSQGHEPILALDVWEHAYYLKYQNKRPDYIDNWWNVLKVL